MDHDTASGMLHAPTLESWADRTLDKELAQLLGDSLESCVSVVDSIEQRLHSITEESQRFKSVVEEEKQV